MQLAAPPHVFDDRTTIDHNIGKFFRLHVADGCEALIVEAAEDDVAIRQYGQITVKALGVVNREEFADAPAVTKLLVGDADTVIKAVCKIKNYPFVLLVEFIQVVSVMFRIVRKFLAMRFDPF